MNNLLVQETSMKIRFGIRIRTRGDVNVSNRNWVTLGILQTLKDVLYEVFLIPHQIVHNAEIFSTGNCGVRRVSAWTPKRLLNPKPQRREPNNLRSKCRIQHDRFIRCVRKIRTPPLIKFWRHGGQFFRTGSHLDATIDPTEKIPD